MNALFQFLAQTPVQGYAPQPVSLAASLLFSLFLGGLMMLVYRLCHDALTYNPKFAHTLLMLAFLSTVLLALIQTNPMLSLGALGALSICRIRTNTRDPRDIGFVFWALSIGISSAVGAFGTGALSTVMLSVFMLVFGRSGKKKNVLTLVVRGNKECIAPVQELFRKTAGSTIQSKNIFPSSFELVYELKVSAKKEENLVLALNDMQGVMDVNVLAPETRVA